MWQSRRPNRVQIEENTTKNFDFAAEQAALLDLENLYNENQTDQDWLFVEDSADWYSAQVVSNLNEDEKTLEEVAEQTTYGAIFLNELIKRQRALGLSVALTFLLIIFSLPIISFLGPELFNVVVFGLPMNWLLLGVLIYPLVWFLAFFFVSTADKYEEEFTQLVSGGPKTASKNATSSKYKDAGKS